MNVQILYNRNYIAFNLYIMSIFKYFQKNNINVAIIDNISLLSDNIDYLILFLNDISLVFNETINNTKVIFIHADKITHHSISDQYMMYNYINKINVNNTFIWEYSPININIYKTEWINTKIHYIPLLYNNSLETLYKENIVKIPYDKKEIEVLFIGTTGSERRRKLLPSIGNKYKLYISELNQNIIEYMQMIENSKIILNIYSNSDNKPFDYYRFAFLYSNKHFVITEKPENIDLEMETNLVAYEEWMTTVEYDNIVETIDIYLKKSSKEIEAITEVAYENFKKYEMYDYIDRFFQSVVN